MLNKTTTISITQAKKETRSTDLRNTLVGLIQQDLRHPLDGYRERYDGVFAAVGGIAMGTAGAESAEHRVARLAEQQLLVDVHRTLGDDLAPLTRHQVQELVYEERRRQSGHSAPGDDDQLPAYWTPGGTTGMMSKICYCFFFKPISNLIFNVGVKFETQGTMKMMTIFF